MTKSIFIDKLLLIATVLLSFLLLFILKESFSGHWSEFIFYGVGYVVGMVYISITDFIAKGRSKFRLGLFIGMIATLQVVIAAGIFYYRLVPFPSHHRIYAIVLIVFIILTIGLIDILLRKSKLLRKIMKGMPNNSAQ